MPEDHPLRPIRVIVAAALDALSPEFAQLYAPIGRPSIPPEKLLRALLLQAFYTVRSERQLMEQLDYNLLFRWFVGLGVDDPVWDATVFTKNRDRLLDGAIAAKFFRAVLSQPRVEALLSDEHFSVDGTLIEAFASMKSFKPKDGAGDEPPAGGEGRNAERDFHGEQRRNATHVSTTDPDARLFRKGRGKEAKLCFSGHVLMENRHGLCVDLQIAPATGTAERETALAMLRRQASRGIRPRTLGADKGYHCRDFVHRLRRRRIRPHLTRVEGRQTPGLDGRTTRTVGYALSQRIRKRVEEIFGWLKTVGGLRKTRFRGLARTQHAALLVGAAYNLLRISRLQAPAPAT